MSNGKTDEVRDPKSRKGTRWKTDEDTQLIQEISDGRTTEEIADAHGRTSRAIECRKQVLMCRFYDEEMSLEDIKELLQMDMPFDEMKKIIKTKKDRVERKKRDQKIKKEIQAGDSKLIAVIDRLDTIAQKLDDIADKIDLTITFSK